MSTSTPASPLDRARRKVFRRIIPIVFLSYVIAYVDRANVGIAKLNMVKDLPHFTEAVFAFGAGIFFLGYFLLEIPGTLLVEKWSARKWISRIMISWGIVAALTAAVKTPGQFYTVRFVLGLAEAGFFPGVIVYFSHWFVRQDRARALSYFLIAAPIAQIISPKISSYFLHFGTSETVNGVLVTYPRLFGLAGWQWVYILWGLPAVLLGFVVFFFMTDRPAQARWLEGDEREALQAELARETAAHGPAQHMGVLQALRHPQVLLLALAQFFAITGNYGMEFFMPTFLRDWYGLHMSTLTTLLMIPFVAVLVGIVVVGWSSDRTGERWLHASLPIFVAAAAMALTPLTRGSLPLTVLLFALTMFGIRGYLPAFWALPSQLLTGAAAAGSIGFINSVANLGGFFGPNILGQIKTVSGSFENGIYVLAASMFASASIILLLGLRHGRQQRNQRSRPVTPTAAPALSGPPPDLG